VAWICCSLLLLCASASFFSRNGLMHELIDLAVSVLYDLLQSASTFLLEMGFSRPLHQLMHTAILLKQSIRFDHRLVVKYKLVIN
jgi:hypothetical protein